MRILLVCFLVIGCAKKEPNDDPKLDSVEQLAEAYDGWLAEAAELRDPKSGWLVYKGCDSLLYTALWASSPGVDGADITASEYPDQPGRFGRRPGHPCWNETEGDVGSATTFSRDHGKGLIVWAYRKGELATLERHAKYGKAHNWKMGEPLADGRVIYSPSLIGELYQAIYALGGENSALRIWPAIYAKGLRDYQAHLQMLSIYLRGSIAEGQSLDISQSMFNRVKEHAEREPTCPFYQYMLAVYTDGDLNPIADLLLNDSWDCEYMRDEENLRLAIKTFAAGLILERVQGFP